MRQQIRIDLGHSSCVASAFSIMPAIFEVMSSLLFTQSLIRAMRRGELIFFSNSSPIREHPVISKQNTVSNETFTDFNSHH